MSTLVKDLLDPTNTAGSTAASADAPATRAGSASSSTGGSDGSHAAATAPASPPKPGYCVTTIAPSTGYYIYVTAPDPNTGAPTTYPVWIPVGVMVATETCYEPTVGSPGVAGPPIYQDPVTGDTGGSGGGGGGSGGDGSVEVPGVPPIPPAPVDFNVGWTGSARSVGTLTADGKYDFNVPTSVVGVVTGFNDLAESSSYTDIDHALYFASGKYQVMEKGNAQNAAAPYVDADVFTIERINGVVTYKINGGVIYTSTAPSKGRVFADASLYFSGDKVVNAVLTPYDTFAIYGVLSGMVGAFYEPTRLTGALTGMHSFFADADYHILDAELPGLGGSFASSSAYQTLQGVLTKMTGEFHSNDLGAVLNGNLPSMSGHFEVGLLAPNYTALTISLQTMSGFMLTLIGEVGRLDGKLQGLQGFFSQPDGAFMWSGAPPTLVGPEGDWFGRSGTQLRTMTSMMLDQSFVDAYNELLKPVITLPMLTVDGNITVGNRMQGNVVLPSPLTTHWELGWVSEMTLPMIEADYNFAIMNTVRADIALPMMSADGTGTVGTIFGTPDLYPLQLPSLLVSGHIGKDSDGAVLLPALQATGRIVPSTTLQGDIRLPRMQAWGLILTPLSIDPQNPLGRFLQGHVLLPPLGTQKYAHGAVLLPRLRLSGLVLGTGAAVEARIAYAMNLKTGAVTEFTHYPFRAMARAFNGYWGVGMDGNLYRMTGDLDDTLPIDWAWESGLNDFGVWGQKAAMAVYIRGVFENGAYVKFVTDDAVREYDHVAAGNYKNQKVHRVSLGRGVRTDSMAFGMANPKGGYLELDKVTPEYRIIPRNL